MPPGMPPGMLPGMLPDSCAAMCAESIGVASIGREASVAASTCARAASRAAIREGAIPGREPVPPLARVAGRPAHTRLAGREPPPPVSTAPLPPAARSSDADGRAPEGAAVTGRREAEAAVRSIEGSYPYGRAGALYGTCAGGPATAASAVASVGAGTGASDEACPVPCADASCVAEPAHAAKAFAADGGLPGGRVAATAEDDACGANVMRQSPLAFQIGVLAFLIGVPSEGTSDASCSELERRSPKSAATERAPGAAD